MNVAGAYPRMNALDALPAKPSNQKGRMMQDVEREKCFHQDEIIQHTGDGSKVAFCRACGNNRFMASAGVSPTMQDVERVARALCLELGRMGDTEAVERNRVEADWPRYVALATAAISAMTPDIWNAAIEAAAGACQSHPEEGSEDLGPGIALAIEIIRALMSPKPPIL